MKEAFDVIEKLRTKTLKLPYSLFSYPIGINMIFYILYKNILKDIICKNVYFILALILTIIIIIFILIYNYYFYFGKKDKINIIINLYSDDKEIDRYVYEIKKEMDAILEEKKQDDVNVIVPNFCRRSNFSKDFSKKNHKKINFTKSKTYKFFNQFWHSQIIIFGELSKRKNVQEKIVINNKILIDISTIKNDKEKKINFITKVISENDQFLVLDKDKEYIEFKNFSQYFSCIAKFFIGIGYFLSDNMIDAFKSHKFVIDNDKNIEKYIKLDKFFYLESFSIINELIKESEYKKALWVIDYLISHNIEKENSIIMKMNIKMTSTNSFSNFKDVVIECLKLLNKLKINKSDHGILTLAYIELCRENYKRALKIYYDHFTAVENILEINYFDVIDYCEKAKLKVYEKEIAHFCLACIYLGLDKHKEFEENFIKLSKISQKYIKESNLYLFKKNDNN